MPHRIKLKIDMQTKKIKFKNKVGINKKYWNKKWWYSIAQWENPYFGML